MLQFLVLRRKMGIGGKKIEDWNPRKNTREANRKKHIEIRCGERERERDAD
jgi:hypothetical protein